jgi:hypothetical protein
MTLRSPVVAMLWESWRLTRVEAAWKLALGIVAGMAALVVFAAIARINLGGFDFDGESPTVKAARDGGAVIALIVIVLPNIVGWWSIGNLNRVRPGFPFYLNYTRPVRTSALVGVPMGYLAAVPAASYIVTALLLRAISGYAFPLMSVAAWIAALNLLHAPTNWPIRNTIIKLTGNMAVGLAWLLLAKYRFANVAWTRPMQWPTIFDFPLSDYALIVAIGLASFGIAVAGVARQRRGDVEITPWIPGAALMEDFVTLFRFPCPTSSSIRAQVWFELKSRGLSVLANGVVIAIVIPLIFAISVPVEPVRPMAAMVGMFSVLAILISAGNAFSIRARQGRVYGSAFDATQPYGSAPLAGLKVIVRSVCVLAALAVVSVSVWASMSFIAVGPGHEPLLGYQPLRSWQGAIENAVGALTLYQQISLAVVASIGVAVMVTSLASFSALAARFPRHMGIGGWLLVFHGLVLVPLVLTGYRGVGSQTLWEFLVGVLVWITRWIDAPAIVFATVYVSWRVFAERLLTLRAACGAVLISAAFGMAWVTMLRAAGAQLADLPMTYAFWMLSPVLLPLMASVVAPWSLNRIRHI